MTIYKIGNSLVLIVRSDRIVISTPLISISLYSFNIGIIISIYSNARKFITRIQITEGEVTDVSAIDA
jgi:hypothetical protein